MAGKARWWKCLSAEFVSKTSCSPAAVCQQIAKVSVFLKASYPRGGGEAAWLLSACCGKSWRGLCPALTPGWVKGPCSFTAKWTRADEDMQSSYILGRT